MYCMFNQLGKYQVKYMNVYLKPLIDQLLDLWTCVTMYDISILIDAQMEFEFPVMLVCTIHDSPGLRHLCGML